MIKWIKWLSKEESHYESSTGLHISFGESLLLTAIHFHSNNLEAITGLVSSTLGMRVRPGTLTRIKTIFTQDLFPEKVRCVLGATLLYTPAKLDCSIWLKLVQLMKF